MEDKILQICRGSRALPPSAALLSITMAMAWVMMLSGCQSPGERPTEKKPGASNPAVANLTDQAQLEKLAWEAEDQAVRWAAIGKLTDQKVLATLVYERKYDQDRPIAVARVTDQAMLARFCEYYDAAVREAAAGRLTNQAVLTKLACGDKSFQVRKVALGRLTDQDALASVACQSDDYYTAVEAVKKLADQEALTKVVHEATEWRVRSEAVSKLANQTTLTKLACEDPDWGLRRQSFNRLDPAHLAEVAESTKDEALRLAALIKLKRERWSTVFEPKNLTPTDASRVLGAVALVDRPEPAFRSVINVCHMVIRQGDASRMTELGHILSRFGNITLAEDYLNCGQSTLADEARAWAKSEGCTIIMGQRAQSVRWGEGGGKPARR